MTEIDEIRVAIAGLNGRITGLREIHAKHDMAFWQAPRDSDLANLHENECEKIEQRIEYLQDQISRRQRQIEKIEQLQGAKERLSDQSCAKGESL
jgi:hypothetical protein